MTLKEVHRQPPKEGSDEAIRRIAVDASGRIVLLQPAIREHQHPVAHRERVVLVVGDVNKGGAKDVVKASQLLPHRDPQVGVQVAQRFIQQEDPRFADDGAAERNPLPLATAQLAGIATEELANAEQPADLLYLGRSLRLWHFAQHQGEGDVLRDRHLGVEPV